MNIKKFEEIKKCDIFSIEENSSKYIALTLEKDLIITYNLSTNTITTLLNNNNNKIYYYHYNLYDLINIKSYKWIGIEKNKIKVIIDLESLSAEYFNYKFNQWEVVENISLTEDNDLIFKINQTSFKIDLNDLSIYVMPRKSLSYKKYNDYVLGEEEDFVFNSDNELELIKNGYLDEVDKKRQQNMEDTQLYIIDEIKEDLDDE